MARKIVLLLAPGLFRRFTKAESDHCALSLGMCQGTLRPLRLMPG